MSETRYFVPWSSYQDSPEEALDHLERNHGRVLRVVLVPGMGGKIGASAEVEVGEKGTDE